jgi:hypothetical protein
MTMYEHLRKRYPESSGVSILMIAGLPQKIGRFSGGARAISKIAEEGISYLVPREGEVQRGSSYLRYMY